MKTVLFLCTGNYYRSRFAEELFNHRTASAAPGWKAHSRALAIERGAGNIGPVSPFVLQALAERGAIAQRADGTPTPCVTADLDAADCIVALHDEEHRPLMRERFPAWETRTEYWRVADVDVASPREALALIENEIEALLVRLRSLESPR